MDGIVGTLSGFMGFVGSLFGGLWAAVLTVLDAVWAAVIYLVGNVVALLVDVLFWVTSFAVSWIPDPPAAPLAGATDSFSFLATANQYVPMVEGGTLLVAWLAIFGWRAGVKLWKMLPLT